MSTANFGLLARRWLWTTLGQDPVLADLGVTVGGHPGPAGTTGQLLTWSTDSPFKSTLDVSERTLHATGTMLIRVSAETADFDDLEPAANRLLELLSAAQNQTITSGGVVLVCRFIRSHEWVEQDNGVDWRALGGVFRLSIQAP